MNTETQTTETKPTPKWSTQAGPIQTRKVEKVLKDIQFEHNHFRELTGVTGVTEDAFYYYALFGGGVREDVKAAWSTLGERYAWTITRDNYTQILSDAEAALAILRKPENLPTKDKRKTQEQHMAEQSEFDRLKKECDDRTERFKGTAPEFQATIKRLADVLSKMPDFVYMRWLKYSEGCNASDQSPVLGEFIQNYAADLGAVGTYKQEKLREALIPPVVPTGVTVRYNTQHDGVEVHFDDKPSAEVLGRLKSAGFKWSPRSKVWYKRYGAYAWSAAHTIAGIPPAEAPKRSSDPEGASTAAYVQAQEDAAEDDFNYVGSPHHY